MGRAENSFTYKRISLKAKKIYIHMYVFTKYRCVYQSQVSSLTVKIFPFYKQSVRGCQRNLLLLAMDGSIREREETKKQEHGKYHLLEF